ncbi:MAG TPA: hypothetical protein VIJ15_12995 [Dermatophilaceae bacterium]
MSFLGVRVPAPTLGNILPDSVTFPATDPTFFFLPGFAILLLVLSANLLGDGLRDAHDPKSDRGQIPESLRHRSLTTRTPCSAVDMNRRAA